MNSPARHGNNETKKKTFSFHLVVFSMVWLYSLVDLNTSPLGRPIWKRLGGVTLLEQVCHWGRVGGFQSPYCSQFALSAFCFPIKIQVQLLLKCHTSLICPVTMSSLISDPVKLTTKFKPHSV